jgi:hypothetical protein
MLARSCCRPGVAGTELAHDLLPLWRQHRRKGTHLVHPRLARVRSERLSETLPSLALGGTYRGCFDGKERTALKRLAMFLDGTWNNPDDNTNVWRSELLVCDRDADGNAQDRSTPSMNAVERASRRRCAGHGSGRTNDWSKDRETNRQPRSVRTDRSSALRADARALIDCLYKGSHERRHSFLLARDFRWRASS